MRSCSLTILLAILSLQLFAQAEFEAYSDADRVLVDSYFEVSYTLRNANGKGFTPPPFRDFVVISGPARSMSTTIINGEVNKEITYSYTLRPKRPGIFEIRPANIDANGKLLRSEALTIEVVRGKPGRKAERDFFVQAVPSSDTAYVGQQVRLDYRLYTTVEIQNYNMVEESSYAGFYAEDIRRPDTRVKQEIVDGVQFYTRNLKTVALYPQQAGVLEIDAASLQLGVVTEKRSSSIFFNNSIERQPGITEPLRITVLPLPSPKPPGFSGAVGQFEVSSQLKQRQLSTDDALELELVIEGNGDLKRIQAPELQLPASFERYEPEVSEMDLGERDGFRWGRKTIRYLALPRLPGTYDLEVPFVYFNPDSARYLLPDTSIYTLQVSQGSNQQAAVQVAPEKEKQADIRPLMLNPRLYRGERNNFLGSTYFWILLLLPLFILAALLLYRQKQQRLEQMEPSERRKRRARQQAQQRLQQAYQHMQAEEARAFYDEVSRAMLGYISDKLSMPWSQLSKENVRSKLQQLELPDDKQERFMQIMQHCELALYAGQADAAAMKQTLDNAQDLMTLIEDRLQAR